MRGLQQFIAFATPALHGGFAAVGRVDRRQLVLCASPADQAVQGRPRCIEDLAAHALVM